MLDPDYGCLVLRVIFGTVGVKGYDWLKEHGRSLGPDDPKPADKTVDRILTVELAPPEAPLKSLACGTPKQIAHRSSLICSTM